ncbi:MAG: 4Fe-4S dicluster domain-containing protein [Candidatus Lokiarchaeota archaeon]|nr:4Fe-4S dicluster domain-containing protein [Candidatus Lokiarchaeota archaeon]MBD3338154.1 4Fe-4S dicluster domain-containing protein [Candidatus Lokiarchaeota archaeon]
MKSDNETAYRKLQDHLDKLPVGYPKTKSGVEIKLLKHMFSPEEAIVATFLKYTPEPLKRIFRRAKKLGLRKEELEQHLENMIKKGSINYGEKSGVKYYANAFLAIGMFEYQLNRLTEDFVKDFHQYVEEAYLDEFHKLTPQIRVIPIERSITPENYIASYNDLRIIIENSNDNIALAECICKKGKDLIGEPCKQTDLREICFAFRGGARHYIEMGFARPIDKETALEILEKAEEDGLILQTGNSQRPNFVCCCCTCCCGLLSHEKNTSNPAKLVHNNYYASINSELCVSCSLCVQRCQMDALVVKEETTKVLEERCIGCGNCVVTCPNGAIRLLKKKEITTPPKNTFELYTRLLDEKAELMRSNMEK